MIASGFVGGSQRRSGRVVPSNEVNVAALIVGLPDTVAGGETGIMNCGVHPVVQISVLIAALVNERNIKSRIMRNMVDKSVGFYMMKRTDDKC